MLTKEKVEIQPIINGSVNPRLTPNLFNELPIEERKSVLWSLIVSGSHNRDWQEIDRDVFVKLEGLPEYNEITDKNVDRLFEDLKAKIDKHYAELIVKTELIHRKQGKKIREAQEELGFNGMLELTVGKLKGYLSAIGSWNEMNPASVNQALTRIHKLAPRTNYGPNNPNTGSINFKYKTTGDYVVLEYGYVDAKEVDRIKEFYNKYWLPIGNGIKADSKRIEITDHGHNHYGVELIWWWD